MGRLLRRWVVISLLSLGNAVVLALLALLVYARRRYGGGMGAGIGPSEAVEAYTPVLVESGGVGLVALCAVWLYWWAGLRYIPELGGRADARLIKASVVTVPLLFAVSYCAYKLLYPIGR